MSETKTLVQAEAEYNKEIARLIDISREMRQQFDMLIATAKLYKPEDRSERDRMYAILITELQKVYAFYKTYLHIGDGNP